MYFSWHSQVLTYVDQTEHGMLLGNVPGIYGPPTLGLPNLPSLCVGGARIPTTATWPRTLI